MDSVGQSDRVRRRAIAIAISAVALLPAVLLSLPAVAGAASVTDVGEGFPTAINASDHIVMGTLGFNEEDEETIKGPWSIWSGVGKSLHLEPLNGEPNGEPESLDHEHDLFLYDINEAGAVAGSSTVVNKGGSEPTSLHRAVSFSATGEAHEVPLLQEEIEHENGKGEIESTPVGALGTGIDNAGDVVGIGVEEIKVDGKPKPAGRAFFAPKGGTPEVVGEADKPSSGGWASEVFEVNGAGTMLGDIVEEEGEKKTRYYLWKSPSEAGTPLNFDAELEGFGLANDGSILGYRDSKLFLRTPDGKETEVSGLDKPFAINATHEVVGSKVLAGVEHAAIWQGGTVTDLNTELPEKSNWVLNRATAINDNGEIAGVGTYEGKTRAFLLKPGLVVTSAKDGKENAGSGAGACDAEGGGCTLRAAIETVNASGSSTATRITFAIPNESTSYLTISPQTPLPAITKPVTLDASTQPLPSGRSTEDTSGLKLGAILDGSALGASANGLELAGGAAGSTVMGLQIQHFEGDGVLLGGAEDQVADSLLYADQVGVKVAADNAVVGAGAGQVGDVFFTDGNAAGEQSYAQSLHGRTLTSAAFAAEELNFGAGVLLSGPSNGTLISGDAIGVHGNFGFGPYSGDVLPGDGFASLTSAGPGVTSTGVLIDAASGQVSGVTIGGARGSASDAIAGDVSGIEVLGASSSVNGVSVLGSSFGDEFGIDGIQNVGERIKGNYLGPLGDVIGLYADGAVSGLQVGAAGDGNYFQASAVGAVLAEQGLVRPELQGNLFGESSSLEGFFGKDGLELRAKDLIGVIDVDTSGALIGGPAGAGNEMVGNLLGLILCGEHLANTAVEGNTIGGRGEGTTPETLGSFNSLIGVLYAGTGKPGATSQNTVFAGNTIQDSVFGAFTRETIGEQVHANKVSQDFLGFFDAGSGGAQIGGGSGQGNRFSEDGAGLVLANYDLSPTELKEAHVEASAASESTREKALSEPDEELVFDEADATSSATLGPESAKTPATPGTQNTILGNTFGVSAAGAPAGNTVGAVILDDEHGVIVGGTEPGQGNTIEDNSAAGLWLLGTAEHAPTAQILGNAIYNNENFTGGAAGLPGLGIDLVQELGSAGDPIENVGGYGFGVNPQDATQPDKGPDNLQNSPVLASATTSAGQLTITGSLHGVASTEYLLEVFADENQNPFGAGEGQTLLERINLSTDASGNVGFTSTVAAPAAGYRFISSTATTVPAGGVPGVTSEFSVNAPITVGGSAPSAPASAPGAPAPGSPSAPAGAAAGAATTTVSGQGTATTSGASVTLPAQVSCSSATASPCTVTTTATVSAATVTKASVTTAAAVATATVAKHEAGKHKAAKRPVTIGRATMTLAPGASAPLQLKLSSSGLALLRSHGSLAITVTVSISGQGRGTTTHTLHFQLKYKKTKGKAK
jgi:hypothetical protein